MCALLITAVASKPSRRSEKERLGGHRDGTRTEIAYLLALGEATRIIEGLYR